MHILQVSEELPIAAPLNQFHIFLHCLDQGEEDNGVDNQIIFILTAQCSSNYSARYEVSRKIPVTITTMQL